MFSNNIIRQTFYHKNKCPNYIVRVINIIALKRMSEMIVHFERD